MGNLRYVLSERGYRSPFLITRNSLNIDPSSEFISAYGDHVHAYDFWDKSCEDYVSQVAGDLGFLALDENLNRHISPFWIIHSLEEAAESIACFGNTLDQMKPEGVVILHVNNFWGRILAYLAQERSIPVFAYQEGLLRKSDEETMNKQSLAGTDVDVMFTWTEEDAATYKDLAGVNAVGVGPIHLDAFFQAVSTPNGKNQIKQMVGADPNRPTIVFAPPLLARYEGNFEESLKALVNHCKKRGVQLLVKLHPFDYNAIEQVEKLTDPFRVVREVDPASFLAAADLVLGQHSTVGVESQMLGTPYAHLDLSIAGISQPVENAPTIYEVDEVDKLLKDRTVNAQPIKLFDGQSSARAADIVERTIYGRQ